MTSRQIAAQYAKALFAVAVTDSDPSRVGEELAAFGRWSRATPPRSRSQEPRRSHPGQAEGGCGTAEIGSTLTLVRHFLVLLGRHDHLTVLDDVVAAYEARLLQHQGSWRRRSPRPRHSATSARPRWRASSPRSRQAGAGVGHRGPRLIGGVVAKVGSTVYDGSVVRQLQRLKEQIIERA